jgi:hypothetical protein
MALTELARFLPRGAQHNRYLRSGMRPHHREDLPDRRRPEPPPHEQDHRAVPAHEPPLGTPAAAAPAATPALGTDSPG